MEQQNNNEKQTPFLKRVSELEKSISNLITMFNELKDNLTLMEKKVETLKKALKR